MGFNLKYGIVSEVKKGFVKVFFEEDDGIVTDWLPVLVRRSKSEKESWQLEINEHVVCLLDKHCEEGVCLGAIHNDEDAPDPGEGKGKFRKKFSDGTVFEYDVTGHKMTIDIKGSLEAITTLGASIDAGTTLKGKAAASAEIEAPVITLKGNVIIQGTATVSGALTAASIATSGGGSINAQGNISTDGDINATGDVVAGGKSLKTHTHNAPSSGGPTSPPL